MANHTHIYIRHAKQFPFHVNRHTDLGEEGRGVRKKKKKMGRKKPSISDIVSKCFVYLSTLIRTVLFQRTYQGKS